MVRYFSLLFMTTAGLINQIHSYSGSGSLQFQLHSLSYNKPLYDLAPAPSPQPDSGSIKVSLLLISNVEYKGFINSSYTSMNGTDNKNITIDFSSSNSFYFDTNNGTNLVTVGLEIDMKYIAQTGPYTYPTFSIVLCRASLLVITQPTAKTTTISDCPLLSNSTSSIKLNYTIQYACPYDHQYGLDCHNCTPVRNGANCYNCDNHGKHICCAYYGPAPSCPLLPTTTTSTSTQVTTTACTPCSSPSPYSPCTHSSSTSAPNIPSCTPAPTCPVDNTYYIATLALAVVSIVLLIIVLILAYCYVKYKKSQSTSGPNWRTNGDKSRTPQSVATNPQKSEVGYATYSTGSTAPFGMNPRDSAIEREVEDLYTRVQRTPNEDSVPPVPLRQNNDTVVEYEYPELNFNKEEPPTYATTNRTRPVSRV